MIRFSVRIALVSLMILMLGAPSLFAKQRLLLGTSTVGGSYYILGGTWAKAINDKLPDIDVAVEVTGGPESNIMLVDKKEMDLGFVTAWKAGDMFYGEGGSKKKFENMRAFAPLYPSYLQMYALASSGIKDLRDVNGKHASTSSAGSTSFLAGRAVIKALGLKPGKVSGMPGSQQLNTLRDGQTDMGFTVGGVPSPQIMELEATHDLHIVTMSKEDIAAVLKEQPHWTEGVIPAGTYKAANAKEDIPVITFWNFAIAHKDIPDDAVYQMTKLTFESLPQLANAVKDMGKLKKEDILFTSIPLHKGAIKYYKEQGIALPEKMIPAEAK